MIFAPLFRVPLRCLRILEHRRTTRWNQASWLRDKTATTTTSAATDTESTTTNTASIATTTTITLTCRGITNHPNIATTIVTIAVFQVQN